MWAAEPKAPKRGYRLRYAGRKGAVSGVFYALVVAWLLTGAAPYSAAQSFGPLIDLNETVVLAPRDPFSPPNPWPPVCADLARAEQEKFDCNGSSPAVVASSVTHVEFPPLRDPYLAEGQSAPFCSDLPTAEREKFTFPVVCPETGSLVPSTTPLIVEATPTPTASYDETVDELFVSFLTKGGRKLADQIRARAEAGDSAAAASYGTSLFSGRSVPRDPGAALTWLGKAAAAGNIAAQRWIGLAHLKGRVPRPDFGIARESLETAAEQGDLLARYYLGYMVEHGLRGPSDLGEAARHYGQAASGGMPYAQMRLGQMLLSGKGVGRDVVRATELFRVAAESGYRSAQTAYAHQLFRGDGALQSYREALKWYERAAGAGDPVAKNMLGYIMVNGLAGEENLELAGSLFLSAAAQGDATAQYNLGLMLRDGSTPFQPNPVLAHALFNLATSKGQTDGEEARRNLESKMSPEQVLKAQHAASRWRSSWSIGDMNLRSTGTGFFVNLAGGLITNQHVVDDCDVLGVRLGENVVLAERIFAVEEVDLALIQLLDEVGPPRDHGVALLSGSDQYFIGEEVTIFGFPLTGFLDKDGVLTIGTLNALAGFREKPDQRFLQVSAQVQSGNSGSAVLDEKGSVIGVVWGGLNEEKITNQNVNFAAKHGVLRSLLDKYGVKYYLSDQERKAGLTRQQRYQIARQMTRQIHCYQYDTDKLLGD